MRKQKPLTSEMLRCLEIIKQHGSIVRYRGGFWQKPNDECAKKFIDRGQLVYNYPAEHISTGTLKALHARGLIQIDEYDGMYYKYPSKYSLISEQANNQ